MPFSPSWIPFRPFLRGFPKRNCLRPRRISGSLFGKAAYGIPTESEKSLSDRRSRLMSKLRGASTTTKEQIRQVVASFANSDCEIIEHPGDYSFDIKFVGTIGIPPNIADVKAAVEEIKPAHLAYQLLYVFHCWQDYAAQTWSSASTKTWAEMKG